MQFVKDGFFPGPSVPAILTTGPLAPVEGGGIDNLAGAVDSQGLKAGGGVRHRQASVDAVAIEVAVTDTRGQTLEPAVGWGGHGQGQLAVGSRAG